MNEKKVQDENAQALNAGTKAVGIKPPTSLKRATSCLNRDTVKISKPSPELQESRGINRPSDATIIRRQTFTIPPKATLRTSKPTTVMASSVIKQVVRGPSTSQSSTLRSKTSTEVPKQRPQWDLRGRLADLESALRDSSQRSEEKIQSLTDECAKLKEELESAQTKAVELEDLRQQLQDKLHQALGSLKEYHEKLELIQEENSMCSRMLSEAKTRSDSLYSEVQAKQGMITSLAHELQEAKSQHVQREHELRECVNKCAELQQISQSYQKVIQDKSDALLLLGEDHEKLKNTHYQQSVTLNALTNELANIKEERLNLLTSLNCEQQKVLHLSAELEALKSSESTKSNFICSLQHQITDLKNVEFSLRNELSDSRSEAASLKHEIHQCQLQLAEADVERRLMHHKILELRGTIRVCCRVRPALPSEANCTQYGMEYRFSDSTMVIYSSQARETVTGTKAESNKYEFAFDRVFGPNSIQQQVFDEIDPLIQSALDGYSVCIFAYGQTGSGKTYTMEGDPSDPEKVGMIQRAVSKIFNSMEHMQRKGWSYVVEASFLEIYNETLRDLLVSDSSKSLPSKLEIKITAPNPMNSKPEKNTNPDTRRSNATSTVSDVYVPNLTTFTVSSASQVQSLLQIANQNRTVAATKCNEFSSRSHSVFRLKLIGKSTLLSETSEALINLVDLAGSERLAQSGAEGDRMKETQHINKSLSCLRTVITSLSKKESHVPFRNSKLTHLLQSSLGGNCKTLMFVNVSPLEDNFQETLCSLRFAATVNKCYIGPATQKKTMTH